MVGNVESDPEYQLIVEVNSLAVEIDNEICKFQNNSVIATYFHILISGNSFHF